jgi:hypothetical protein
VAPRRGIRPRKAHNWKVCVSNLRKTSPFEGITTTIGNLRKRGLILESASSPRVFRTMLKPCVVTMDSNMTRWYVTTTQNQSLPQIHSCSHLSVSAFRPTRQLELEMIFRIHLPLRRPISGHLVPAGVRF